MNIHISTGAGARILATAALVSFSSHLQASAAIEPMTTATSVTMANGNTHPVPTPDAAFVTPFAIVLTCKI